MLYRYDLGRFEQLKLFGSGCCDSAPGQVRLDGQFFHESFESAGVIMVLVSDQHGIDAAILDVQLDGNERSFELAACLQAMRVPFAFITGYSRPSWPLAFQRVPFFSKPLVSEDVSNLLSQLLPPPGGHT